MFVDEMICTFAIDDEIENFTASNGNNCIAYPVAYSKKNRYFLDYNVEAPYDKIDNENDRKRLIEKDTSFEHDIWKILINLTQMEFVSQNQLKH